jgi:hypothetical protein
MVSGKVLSGMVLLTHNKQTNSFNGIYRVRKRTSLIKYINPTFRFSKPQRGSFFIEKHGSLVVKTLSYSIE